MSFLLTISRAIDALNERVGRFVGWLLPIAVLVCAFAAISRYFFNTTTIGIVDTIVNQRANTWFELQWYLYSAIFLLGAAYTLRRNEHVRIDVVSSHFSQRTRAWIDIVGLLLFLLPMTWIFIRHAVPYTVLSFRGDEINNAGGLPTWPAKALIVAGFALLALQGVSELIKRIGFLVGRVDPTEFERAQPESMPHASSAAATTTTGDVR